MTDSVEDVFASYKEENSPSDIIRHLTGLEADVRDIVVVVETNSDDILLLTTDMRKTEIVGLLEYAKLGFAHAEQHVGGEEVEEDDSVD